MKKRVVSLLALMLCLMMTMAVPVAAFTGQAADVTIYGTYDYDEANEVLRLVNEARAEEGKDPLVMDPILCSYAMQRAAELAVYYSHTRPDGTTCFTVMESTHRYGSSGENIAMGQTSAAQVTNAWLNSEGHYNNIMGVYANYQTIGVGCFYQEDGTMCWVQLFSSLSATDTYNKSGTDNVSGIPVKVDSDVLNLHVNGADDCGNLELYAGSTATPTLELSNSGWSYASWVKLDGGYSFTIDDTTVAKTNSSGTTVTGVKPGQTTMTVNFGGGQIYATVDVIVYASPVLTGTVDSNGNHVLTWNDEVGKLYLFGKGENDELWSLLSYPVTGAGSYTNYSAWSDDSWTYVLRIRNEDYTYTDATEELVLSDLAAPVVKIGNVASTGKIKLTWDAVVGASKYRVYRSTDKENWTLLKTTTGTSLTNTSAEPGELYYYYVVAVSEDGTKSGKSNIVSRTCDLPQPEVTLSNVASSGKIKISWDAIDGAVKYKVYYSTDKENWTLLKNTTGTSLTHSSTTAGTLYYYKVKALAEKSSADSAYSSVKSRTCDLARPVVTLSNNEATGKIKISWNAIEGAVKYKVYYSTDKENWTLVKTTTGTGLTHSSTNAGTLYYYKVKAIASTSSANSSYSSVKSRTCDLARPVVTLDNSTAGKIKINWKPIEGAVKYKVYRSTDGENWTLVKTTTGTSLTNAGLTSGTGYYYKVMSLAESSAANSAYSRVKSITAQ